MCLNFVLLLKFSNLKLIKHPSGLRISELAALVKF